MKPWKISRENTSTKTKQYFFSIVIQRNCGMLYINPENPFVQSIDKRFWK